MDRIDARLRELGYDNLWAWLAANPDLHWVEVGKELGFIPIAVMRKSAKEAASFADAVRQGLLREMRRFFPNGWDASDRWARAQLTGQVGGEFGIEVSTLQHLYERINRLPPGWRPTGVDDPDLVAVTEGLFDASPDAESRRS